MDSIAQLQASIAQEPEKNMTIEDRLAALVQRLKPADGAAADVAGITNPQESDGLAVDLLALVDVSAKIMQLDKLAAQAAEVSPTTNSEAKMWHELSLNTLQFSRQTLIKQQQLCAERLGNHVPGGTPKSPQSPKSPTCTATAPVPAFPKAVEKETPTTNGKEIVGTLRKNLEFLQEQNPMSILIIRRINRLGFQSATFLEKHFAKFGDGALEVLVAHSRVKPSLKRPVARVRPAGIGFVVMKNSMDVDSLLAAKHVINGVTIQVQRYEVRSFAEFDDSPVDESSTREPSTHESSSRECSDHEEAVEV